MLSPVRRCSSRCSSWPSVRLPPSTWRPRAMTRTAARSGSLSLPSSALSAPCENSNRAASSTPRLPCIFTAARIGCRNRSCSGRRIRAPRTRPSPMRRCPASAPCSAAAGLSPAGGSSTISSGRLTCRTSMPATGGSTNSTSVASRAPVRASPTKASCASPPVPKAHPKRPNYHKACQTFQFKPGDIRADWTNLQDVEVIVYHFWTDSHLPIKSVDTTSNLVTFACKASKTFTDDFTENGARYIVENVFEGLDAPGEWYLNRPHRRPLLLSKTRRGHEPGGSHRAPAPGLAFTSRATRCNGAWWSTSVPRVELPVLLTSSCRRATPTAPKVRPASPQP